MKILLVVATNSEIIKSKFKNQDVLVTGIGMVNTTFLLTKKLIKESYDLVINMGIAGVFIDKFEIGEVVEVKKDTLSEIGFENGIYFSEFNNNSITTSYSVKTRTKLKKAVGITVNTVHGNKNTIDKINKRLQPDIESMEGAAFFMVCTNLSIPCIQIRSISNRVEIRDKKKWNLGLAILNLNNEVERIINSL
tara:strand:- start:140 stop:718 length:579 start_codon:yes stop_codon:yes gene_type:complete